MAKLKDLPHAQPAPLLTPPPESPNEPRAASGGSVLVEIPYAADLAAVAWCLHIDTRTSAAQANALRRIAAALESKGETLANGRPVKTPTDALKWVLEHVA